MKNHVIAATFLFATAEAFAPICVSHRSVFRIALSASNRNEINPIKPGSTCALITPFTAEGSIDVPKLRKLLRFHVDNCTDGLCILGTTGEASVMSMAERAVVLETAVEEVKGKIPILAGTGTIDPKSVREMTLQAIDVGCDASLVVTPYYVKPPQRGLIKHFLAAADLGLPVIVYNIPGRTKVDFAPESIALVADHENIVGVKEATGDVTRVDKLRELTGDKLLLLSGDDKSDADFVLRGGDGCISVVANLAPKAKHDLMMAALRGDVDQVDRIGSKLRMLNTRLFVESNPIPVKWAAMRMGLISHPFCRPPLDELDPKFRSDVEEAMFAAGLLAEIYQQDEAVMLGA